jgi:flagellin
MSLSINLNSAAMNATRNLQNTNNMLGKSIERLSSGFKINRASDDPAGLVNSESLRSQISGLGQAISNSQDGVNMVKTAEGALSEVHSLLHSMRDLAVHAANTGANSSDAITADQAQISSAIESLNRISSTTAFGSKKLLDGSASYGFDSVVAGTGGAKDGSDSDFTGVTFASSGSSFANATGNKALTITLTQDASKATSAGTVALAGAAKLSTVAGWTATTTSNIKVNGVDIGTFNANSTGDDIINAINNNSVLSQSVVASRDGGNHIQIVSKDYGSSQGISVDETLQDATGAGNAAAAYILTGGTADTTDNAAHLLTTANWGTDLHADVSGNGVGGGTVAFNAGSGFSLKDAAGDVIDFSSKMTGTTANGATYTTTVNDSGAVFQIGANAGETAKVGISSTSTDKIGTGASSVFDSLADIDVTSNASEAIKVIDKAISQISKQRADLGAFQKNVLESNINSLGVTKENVAASESSIRDADMAAEMVNFTKNNILEQAGTSMLAQANQVPQQLLSLLR